MLVRTRAFAYIFHAVARIFGPAYMINIAREKWFSELQDILTRPKFCWKIKMYHRNDIVVLTDHPVCQTNGLGIGGQVTIVPLSKHRVLFGGNQEAVNRFDIPAENLNCFLSACAERSIFAAESKCLETVAQNLRGEGSIDSTEWCNAARRPFFGFTDRLKDRRVPPDFDVSKWWNQIKESYGETILPWRKEKK
jgi:hypothetical protein